MFNMLVFNFSIYLWVLKIKKSVLGVDSDNRKICF